MKTLFLALVLFTGCGAILIRVPEKCFSMSVPMYPSAATDSGYTSTQMRALPTALIQNFDKLRELHVTRGTLTLPIQLSTLTVAAQLPHVPDGSIVSYAGPSLTISIPASSVNLIQYVDSRGLISFQFALSGKDVLLAQPWSMKAYVCLAGEASP